MECVHLKAAEQAGFGPALGCNMRCKHRGSSCHGAIPGELTTSEAYFQARKSEALVVIKEGRKKSEQFISLSQDLYQQLVG